MRQLNQQIQMLVEESAARKKLRRQPGGDRGPGPGPATKKKLVSPALASPGAGGVAGALHDTPKGRGRGGGPSPGGGPPPSKRPKVRQLTRLMKLPYVLNHVEWTPGYSIFDNQMLQFEMSILQTKLARRKPESLTVSVSPQGSTSTLCDVGFP